ncbi:MAG: efflux RND transporter periplasmic adaptor subunit [Nevskiaceae bacterium]|nr:MAG: efflux RND transporter periplasmic adaptor subunit [Nevskiaceae bacterium]TBR72560.1 MAG: efflux RND transporter periplasmic adaptor subunit [Nevskiaceae bacterium]
MNNRILLLAVPFLLGIGIAAGVWWGRYGAPPKPDRAQAGMAATPAAARKVLYWYDPMQPQVHFSHPGKSPFMDMALQPKYAENGSSSDSDTVSVDPRMAQNLGLRVATVTRGAFARHIDTVGTVAVDQNRIRSITARAQGYLERLDVRAVGDPVRRGQVFGAVYAPKLLAAQEELLLAKRGHEPELVSAARQRLRLLGASDDAIAATERSGKARRDLPLVSPVGGVITQLNVREGDPVSPGTALAQVADLSKVWIEAQVPEAQAGWVATGDLAEVALPALPGQTFRARVDYVYPDVQASTRTLRVRLVVDNLALALKPGMYAQVRLRATAQQNVLTVPDEAVLHDGDRRLVMLARGEGHYAPRYVTLGADDGTRSVVLHGLEAGDRVVVSGQFLIDSEASLTGGLQRLQKSNVRNNGEQGRETGPAASPSASEPATPGASSSAQAPPNMDMPGMDMKNMPMPAVSAGAPQ